VAAAALDRLEACQEALIRAFDAHPAEAIEAASADYLAALDEVRGIDFWTADPALKSRLEKLLGRTNEAQMRVNFLTAMAERRQRALSALRGRPASALYTRHGG